MKHLEKGRSQRLAGKRKSNKPSKSRPSSLRQQQVARRKKQKLDNLRKREHTAAAAAAEQAKIDAKNAVAAAAPSA
ncbi:MAG TPA: hypothetical protein PKI32_09795 [Opitutales bacterium]|nr:hypothetical protein [Opitutales bacterium]